jgi:UDP-N-acetylmuramoylalanine--D-glutamate ligase
MDFKNKKIAVLGLGVEGLSSVRFLTAKGAQVTAIDEREKKDFDQRTIDQLSLLGVKLLTGSKSMNNLGRYDMLVRSPGVKSQREELQLARRRGVIITSQTQIFLEQCPCRVIGVTGTKGKGTTSALIYEMLKQSKLDAYLGGNIGVPPFDFLDKLTPHSWVVLELSSFQLQDITISQTDINDLAGKPHIAVMLMIVPEHLDYHKDIEEYVSAKRNILRFQTQNDFAILNRDYVPTNESDIFTNAQVFFVTRERSSVSQGAFIRSDAIWLKRNGKETKIINLKDIKLVGKHNWENVLAAVVAANLAGVSRESIAFVLKRFTGLPHRLELVREVRGVKYYDDSFSTTPETAIAAIEAFEEPEILILGGSSKNSNFSELGQIIAKARNIKAIIGIGAEWPKIRSKIKNSQSRILFIEGAKDMRTIVQAAAKIAQPGDVVLLSPACASFDMFKNYKHRGELFKREVNNLT